VIGRALVRQMELGSLGSAVRVQDVALHHLTAAEELVLTDAPIVVCLAVFFVRCAAEYDPANLDRTLPPFGLARLRARPRFRNSGDLRMPIRPRKCGPFAGDRLQPAAVPTKGPAKR
jgi:hypothetical protein